MTKPNVFVIIKPDAVKNKLANIIWSKFIGYTILNKRIGQLSEQEARDLHFGLGL